MTKRKNESNEEYNKRANEYRKKRLSDPEYRLKVRKRDIERYYKLKKDNEWWKKHQEYNKKDFEKRKLNGKYEEKKRKAREKHARNPMIEKIRWLKKQYGLSEEEYLEYFKKQNNICALCKVAKITPFTRTTHVDHEHVEGYNNLPPEERKKYVRGVLCQNCNLDLGKYERIEKWVPQYRNTYRIQGACHREIPA